MKVILKPVSHPQLGEISIVDDLFAIGRNEEPFASGLGDAKASLSRRHARVFQEGGKIFLTDLGSRNGTCVNRRELKHHSAVVLKNNDRVVFGGEVEFQIEVRNGRDASVSRAPAIRLTLVPEHAESGLDAIAIDRFPFLVSRVEGEFEQCRERSPDAWRRLSRRHAVIALKSGQVKVEDLGSRNGTFVSGAQLDERARELSHGDVVSFGDPLLSYRVHIEKLHEPTQIAPTSLGCSEHVLAPGVAELPACVQQQPEEAAVVEQPMEIEPSVAVEQPAPVDRPAGPNRTRLVSSADSFINVFCADDESLDAKASGNGTARTQETKQLRPPTTRLGKFRATIGQLWRALGGSNGDRRIFWGAAGALAVIAVLGAATYLVGLDRRHIKSLLDEGRYSESATAANDYLQRNDDDLEAGTWGEEALTRAIVPVWMDHIEQGRFEEAATYLAAQREAHQAIPRGLQMIETLQWAGTLEAHIADRGGAAGPIVMFRHEEPIRRLVEEWGENSFRRQQIMDQIAAREPKFEPVRSRIFSNLTSLRTDNALYVKAIEQLKNEIQTALQRDDRQSIDKAINAFASDYPRVAGVDGLREDLVRYDTLYQFVRQKELLQLVQLNRSAQFRTPIFSDYVALWLAKELPPADIIDKHAEADAAWRAGNHDEAITILKSVETAPWGEVATRQIARYQKIGADYDALLASKGTDQYYDRLLVVWSSLRPDEDEHLIRTLEPDFVAHRDEVVPRLTQSLERVRVYWRDYQNGGGIPGVVRVEERVTPRFSGQAKRLSSAYNEITSGARTYQLLQITPPDEWQSLQREVVDEVQRQRRWLQDLNIVMEPRLLHAKLELLPDVSEQSLWVQSTTDPKKD